MADENFTLSTIYENWKTYQDHIKASVAPLSAEQLTLRAAPDLRTIGENVTHIIGCRVGWFVHVLGEGSAAIKDEVQWKETDALRTTIELVHGLEHTWQFMTECIARWSDADMHKTFEDDWGDGKIVHLSRAWIVAHVLEHDLHHGGEVSLTLGMHGIEADFPG